MNAPDPQSASPAGPPRPPGWKFWRHLRFSLASLLLFILLGASLATTWWRWDPWTLEKSLSISTHEGVSFSSDQKSLFLRTHGWQDSLEIRHIATDQFEKFDNHLAHSADGRWVVQGQFHENNFLSLTDRQAKKKIELPMPLEKPLLLFSPDSRYLLLISAENKITLRHLADGSEATLAQASSSRADQFGFSSRSKWLYIVGMDGGLRLWETSSARLIKELPPSTNYVGWVVISPDEKHIVFSRADGQCSLYDLPAFSRYQDIHITRELPFTVAFSSEHPLIAISEWTGEVGVYGLNARWRMAEFRTKGVRANVLAFSPDGRCLAVGLSDGSIHAFDFTGWPLFHIPAEEPYIGSEPTRVIHDPSSPPPLIAENSSDEDPVRTPVETLWEDYSRHGIPLHSGNITHIQYLSGGEIIRTQGHRGRNPFGGLSVAAGLWDSHTGRSLFEGMGAQIYAVSDDGYRAAGREGNSDGIQVWQRRRPHTQYRLQSQPEIALAAILVLIMVVRIFKAWRKPR